MPLLAQSGALINE